MPALGITGGPHQAVVLVLPPSQEVGSTSVSLSLFGCRYTGKGEFQRNLQS